MDFSHRYMAWRLGPRVNIYLDGLAMLGLCSMAVTLVPSSTADLGTAPVEVASPVAGMVGPDQLLTAYGAPALGRVLTLSAPLLAMRPSQFVGLSMEMVLGPAKNMTWTNSVGNLDSGRPGPSGQVYISNATLIVPATEVLFYHYASIWADTAPKLTERGTSTSTNLTTNSKAQVPDAASEALILLFKSLQMDIVRPEDGPFQFKAYSMSPRALHVDAWAPMNFGNTMRVSLAC